MRTVFNIVRNIFAVIGIVLKSSGAYCPDATEFNIHPVTDSARADAMQRIRTATCFHCRK